MTSGAKQRHVEVQTLILKLTVTELSGAPRSSLFSYKSSRARKKNPLIDFRLTQFQIVNLNILILKGNHQKSVFFRIFARSLSIGLKVFFVILFKNDLNCKK